MLLPTGRDGSNWRTTRSFIEPRSAFVSLNPSKSIKWRYTVCRWFAALGGLRIPASATCLALAVPRESNKSGPVHAEPLLFGAPPK
jgi:hypothetical protein